MSDVNDNAPYWNKSCYHLSLREDESVGKRIAILSANDVDTSNFQMISRDAFHFSDTALRYDIENEITLTRLLFGIDTHSGAVFVKVGQVLELE